MPTYRVQRRSTFILVMATLSVALVSAQQNVRPPVPPWLQAKIAAFSANPKLAEATEIRRIKYKDQDVYLFVAPCCDQFNALFDLQGARICAPSGGIAGRGDGKCPGADSVASELVWKLPATPTK